MLTGGGGGEWVIPLGPDDGGQQGERASDVTITADVVDFCRLAGDRLSPAQLACEIGGDASLARDVLSAASAFATL